MAVKYIIEFSDFYGKEYQAWISPSNYIGDIYYLKGVGDACVISWGNEGNKFNTINGSECRLTVYNDLIDQDNPILGYHDLTDLYTIDPFGTVVEVYEMFDDDSNPETDPIPVPIWFGFVNPEVYDEDFTWSRGEITIYCNDGLSQLDRKKYFDTTITLDGSGEVKNPERLGVEYIKNILLSCLQDININEYYTLIDIISSSAEFEDFKIDLSNFVDEDNESATRREVLEWILTTFGIRLSLIAGKCFLVDPAVLAIDNSLGVKIFDSNYSNEQIVYMDFRRDLKTSNNESITEHTLFVNANQRMTILSGYNKLIFNYSPYPSEKKIANINSINESPIVDKGAPLGGVYNNQDDSFATRNYLLSDEELLRLGIQQEVTPYFGNPVFSYWAKDENSVSDADIDSRYVGKMVTGFTPGGSLDPTKKIVTIKGGWIPVTTDSITIKGKFIFVRETRSDTNADRNCARVRIPLTIKIGNYYATGGITNYNSTPVKRLLLNDYVMNGTSPNYVWLDIENPNSPYYCGADYDFSFKLTGISHAGFLEFSINYDNRVIHFSTGQNYYKAYASAPEDYRSMYDYAIAYGMKDIEIIINGHQFNEDDIEYVNITKVDFKDFISTNLNISSKRDQGCLDRACLINLDDEHQSEFYRLSDGGNPIYSNIAYTLSRSYFSNYNQPYKSLTGTILAKNLIRNTDNGYIPANRTYLSLAFTPITIIKHSDYFNYPMMFMGGEFNLVTNEIDGVWNQIFTINAT